MPDSPRCRHVARRPLARWRTSLWMLAVAVGVGACGGEEVGGSSDGTPRQGGTIVVGIPSDIQSVNPLTNSDATSSRVQENLLLMTVLRMDSTLTPQPYLAESWDTVRVAPDTLALTFHLRGDVYWHDGEITDANDVLFTFDRAIYPETAYPNSTEFALWRHEAELIDDRTIRFFVRPHADFLVVWTGLAIAPEHLLADVAPAQFAQAPWGIRDPVGNGPFRFVRRLPNQRWVFDANEEFPEALGGRPLVDRVVLQVIPEGNTRLTELLTGGIDVYPDVTPSQVQQIESTADVHLASSPFRAYDYVGWNTRIPMFSDARVRRALSMAIDREELVNAMLYGQGEPGISTSTPAHWSYEVQSRIEVPHDTARARALLAEAGWTDRDGDGVLENEAGEPFHFTLVTNQGSDLRRDVGEVIQAQLGQIGVDVEFRTLEWNTLIAMLDGSVNAQGVRERNYEAVISGWVNGFRKDDASVLHSRNANGPFAETGFTDSRIDALIDTLNVTLDRTTAAPLWEEYHRILVEEGPYAVLFYPNVRVAYRDRVHGMSIDPRGNYATVSRWWVD